MNNKKKPPRLAEWIIHLISKPEERFSVIGDFEEIYGEIAIEGGIMKAQYWYWFQIIKSAPLFLVNYIYWSVAMFKSYVKVALRNMQKQKLFSFINISGLAIGMACAIVIMLYIKDEFSYDRFHENADRIYRIEASRTRDTSPNRSVYVVMPADREAFNEIPEIESVTRYLQTNGTVTRYEDKQFAENPRYVDPTFFEIFSFPLLRGDPKTALNDPYTAVITEEIAHKYFGDEEPVGKMLIIDNNQNVIITGILQEIPRNSHIKPTILVSLSTAKTAYPFFFLGGGKSTLCSVYIMLKNEASPAGIEDKLNGIIIKLYSEAYASLYDYFVQPITGIHLHSKVNSGIEYAETNDIMYSYVLGIIALMIVIIASINFMNLSTARSSIRAKEVGMRKVVGAHRKQLIMQFIGESVILSFIALLFAVIVASLFLPYFNNLLEKELTLDLSRNYFLYAGLFALNLFVGVLAGSYPAFYLSAFHPVEVLKGGVKRRIAALFIRRGLVIFQFALSLFFIIGTALIFKQMQFVKNKDLGYNADQYVVMSIFKSDLKNHITSMKTEFLKNPNVISASATRTAPGYTGSVLSDVVPEGFTSEDEIKATVTTVDYDFFKTMDVDIVAGRDFSPEFPADSVNSVIVNEAAVKKFGWDEPIGKQIKLERVKTPMNVVGVVKDYHYQSLHDEIIPRVYRFDFSPSIYFIIKISLNNIPETLDHLKAVWDQFSPDYVFSYSFLDQVFEREYRHDLRIQKIFLLSSLLAIFIACLGLFGLASFTAERRTKEIGIRKVLGASVSNIITLITKEFVILVVVANVLAWPAAYFVLSRWLQNFAYQINLGIWVFILAGILTLAIALITISYQSIKAATANPIDSLRYE